MNNQPTHSVDLSIIIVNWNSAAYVRRCLVSLQTANHLISHEIIIVDNASEELLNLGDSAQGVTIRKLVLDHNYGFGIANNRGAAIAHGQYLLFLNPDTILTSPETLIKTLEFIRNNPGYGCVGVRYHKEDGRTQRDCARTKPTTVKLLLDITALDRLLEKIGWSDLFCLPRHMLFSDQDVEIVSGAFMLIPSVIFKEIGGFRKNIFLYGEDVDLCLRIRHNGIKIRYMGTMSIIHTVSGSTRKESFQKIVEYQYQAHYRLLEQQYGHPIVLRYISLLILTLPALIAIAPIWDLYKKFFYQRKAFPETARCWYGFLWSLRTLLHHSNT